MYRLFACPSPPTAVPRPERFHWYVHLELSAHAPDCTLAVGQLGIPVTATGRREVEHTPQRSDRVEMTHVAAVDHRGVVDELLERVVLLQRAIRRQSPTLLSDVFLGRSERELGLQECVPCLAVFLRFVRKPKWLPCGLP